MSDILLLKGRNHARESATAERELRALAAASRLHPDATPVLLTLTRDAMPASIPKGIRAEPAYEWILSEA